MENSSVHPVSANQFTVEIERLGQSGKFQATSVSGLGMQIECLPVQEGSMKEQVTRKGRAHCQDISITRHFTTNKDLFDWFKECRDKGVEKSNGSVIVKDDEGKIILRFDFTQAWPISWTGPHFGSGGEGWDLGQESVVLSVQSLDLR